MDEYYHSSMDYVPSIGDIIILNNHFHYLIIDEKIDPWEGKVYTTWVLENGIEAIINLYTMRSWGYCRKVA